jgi:two-component system, NtrC family, C4-dicarboxylate transport response regulator DctD
VVRAREIPPLKLRVVLVEDDAENRRALAELLAVAGFELLPFESAETAWEAIASGRVQPHVVVSDVRMPGLDGVTLLRRIRARFPSIRVVLVSAFPDEAVWREGLRAGALDVFPKPLHGTSLVRALRDATGTIQE